MKKILFFIVLAFFTSCIHAPDLEMPHKQAIYGLATPIRLQPYTTTVYLSDYFPDTKQIDSVWTVPGIDITQINGDWVINLKINETTLLPWIMSLYVRAGGYTYAIPMFKSRKQQVSYSLKENGKHYKSVQIRGEMTAWAPKDLQYFPVDSSWKTGFLLEPGKYQYLVIIDGKEQTDPDNPQTAPNGFGGKNSVLAVGKTGKDKIPYLETVNFDSRTHSISVNLHNQPSDVRVYLDNTELDERFTGYEDSLLVVYLPKSVRKLEYAYLRVYAANSYGFSNDLLIPLKYGKPVESVADLPRDDFHTAIIYNIMVDRFYNGDTANDPQPLDSVLPPAQYHGGDLQGIIKVLQKGYFDTLGVNTLWISPIVKNVRGAWGEWKKPFSRFSAYHGYWPVSLTQIDPRLGNSQALMALTDDLHASEKNLILDFVAHHVHKSYTLYKEHPEYFTNLYLPDGRLNTELWDEQRLTTWFDVFLPTFNTALPQIYNMVADSAVWWAKTYNLDGFRHDAAKHVHLELWRALTRKLKLQVEIPENRKVYQIGETYGSPDLIASYLGSGLLDAQFDFNVYDKLKACLAADQSFTDLKNELDRSFEYYGWHNLMGYITGNQDQGRIISYLNGDLPLNVWGNALKQIGWTNPPAQPQDSLAYRKAGILFAFIMTIPGVPVIYYGDEIGMPGAGDPDNRRDMQFDGLNMNQKWLRGQVARLAHLRRNSMPLTYGDFHWLYTSDDVLVYSRTYFDNAVIVALNKSSVPKTVHVTVPATGAYKKLVDGAGLNAENNGQNLSFDLTIPAVGYKIIK